MRNQIIPLLIIIFSGQTNAGNVHSSNKNNIYINDPLMKDATEQLAVLNDSLENLRQSAFLKIVIDHKIRAAFDDSDEGIARHQFYMESSEDEIYKI